jgi:hypothetical protein
VRATRSTGSRLMAREEAEEEGHAKGGVKARREEDDGVTCSRSERAIMRRGSIMVEAYAGRESHQGVAHAPICANACVHTIQGHACT